jgi:hypothetical protein
MVFAREDSSNCYICRNSEYQNVRRMHFIDTNGRSAGRPFASALTAKQK